MSATSRLTRAGSASTEPAAPSSTNGEAPAGRGYVRLVLVLGALIALGPLTIDMYLPALPSLTADLHTTAAGAQATITGMLVGLGAGQLAIGPLSDAWGRRAPLIAGVVVHLVASVLCVLAPTVGLLAAARVLQGVAGAAISVVSLAVVRDLFAGNAAATLLSRLMLVTGIAPILAPSLGGFILSVTTWRGIFAVLGGAAFVLLWIAVFGLRETLPRHRRRPARPSAVVRTYAGLLRDREFMALVLVSGLVFATLFAYISGASFVLQDVYGLTPRQFALAFGANSLGLVLATQVNPWLVRRYGPRRILQTAVIVATGAALLLLAGGLLGVGGLAAVLAPLWVIIACAGFSFPNTPALALSRHGEAAGTAAALLGAAQFVIGGVAAPLVGAFGTSSAVPMAAVMVAATAAASALLLTSVRGGDPEPAPVDLELEPVAVEAELASCQA